jgi:hypothetical protein
VNDVTIGRQEMTGDVAAILVDLVANLGDLKVTDLLMS